MKILISNDDGVFAPGLEALYHAFKPFGKVWVVAPMEEKSTTGHSLTLHKPLRIYSMKERLGLDFHGVSGSPADCVYVGIREVMKGQMPDWVISGINRGANMGQDVYYSGTVSAAREACILGLRSMAVSLAMDFDKKIPEDKLHYKDAARYAAKVIQQVDGMSIPKHTLLNLNVPDLAYNKIKGLTVARQGFRHYSGTVVKRTDHRGRDYFWVGGQYQGYKKEPGTDCFVVGERHASLTPMKLDVTDFEFLNELEAGLSQGKRRAVKS